MKRSKLSSFIITVIIMFFIGLLLFFNYFNFKVSPGMVESNKIKEIIGKFEVQNSVSGIEIESRYFLDQAYYSGVDDTLLYFFNDNGELLLKQPKDTLQFDKVEAIMERDHAGSLISLAIFEEKPVYVIINKDYDVFLDFDNFKEVYKFRKGIENE